MSIWYIRGTLISIDQYFGQILLVLSDQQSKILKVHYVDYVERYFLMPKQTKLTNSLCFE